MRTALTLAQAVTFVGLAAVLAGSGEPRLAVAQALLAVITVVVYL